MFLQQLSNVGWGQTIQGVVDLQKQLVVDTLLHRQPMQLLKDRLDVMAVVYPGDKACCTVLYALKPLQLALGDAVEQCISHVQPRYNECMGKALGGVHSQKGANVAYVVQVVIGHQADPADVCRHGQMHGGLA